MNRRRTLAGLFGLLLPSSAAAQQSAKVYRIGYLGQVAGKWLTEPFAEALRQRGLVVGRNVRLEARYSGAAAHDAEALARELVAMPVDVLVVTGTHMAVAARRATSTVPIVMYMSGWPVEGGLVASYARPGGNITGLSTYGGSGNLFAKFMGLLSELVPSLRELGVLWDYVPPLFLEKEVEKGVGELMRAAQGLGIRSRNDPIHDQAGMDVALSKLERAPIQALFLTSGPVVSLAQNVQRINDVVMRRRLPVMCDIAASTFRNVGVLAYSVNWHDVSTRCASFVERILRGANPAELPIEQPTNFELILHAGRAKAIGLKIPPAMLVRADRVIE
jgi:putative ABC transport system substrate-binding protein